MTEHSHQTPSPHTTTDHRERRTFDWTPLPCATFPARAPRYPHPPIRASNLSFITTCSIFVFLLFSANFRTSNENAGQGEKHHERNARQNRRKPDPYREKCSSQ